VAYFRAVKALWVIEVLFLLQVEQILLVALQKMALSFLFFR
jgi:hypothetical protein